MESGMMANYYDDGEARKPWDHVHQARQCVLTDLAELKGEAPGGFVDDCNEYLSVFAAPIWVNQFGETQEGDSKVMACLHCGEPLTGMFASLLGRGGFEWGLAHGEGRCSACGWPARAYHNAKNKAGEGLFTLRPFVLQYLPDFEAEAKAKAERVSV